MAYSDVELLARLIQCEAGGEGETGMQAVATVIMNRLRIDYGEYGRLDTLQQIIFQRRQFVCAMETVGGEYNMQNLYNMSPGAQEYAVAQWALAGNVLPAVGYALWFYSPYGADCRQSFPTRVGEFAVQIGGHCFYSPTAYYADT